MPSVLIPSVDGDLHSGRGGRFVRHYYHGVIMLDLPVTQNRHYQAIIPCRLHTFERSSDGIQLRCRTNTLVQKLSLYAINRAAATR